VADKHRLDAPSGLFSPGAWAGLLPLLGELRRQRYDQLLLLHHLTTLFGLAKYRLLVRLIRAGRAIGLDNGRGVFLDVRVPDRGFGELHEVDYCLRVAEAAGAQPLADPRLEIALQPADHARAAELLGGSGSEWIALHPGGGSFSLARRWPAEEFAAVGRALAARTAAGLVIVGSEPDREPADELQRRLERRALDLVGRTSVKEAAAVLRRCRLLVSNDSGVVALAAAVGTPVVAIFGPSNDRAWGPYPPAEHRVVRATLPCSPCFYRGKRLGTPQGCPTRDCLALVTPNMVVAAAGELLGRSRMPLPA
jgi:lipopolysaccharide heptosyltransferase II